MLLEDWPHKHHYKHRELESVIGHLQHGCQVVSQGHTFLPQMINLLYSFQNDNHPIWLNKEFHLDLTWWKDLFHRWNGLSFLLTPCWAPLPDFQVSSDAAGSIGYRAFFQKD